MTDVQLDFDGGETANTDVVRVAAPFTSSQREILRIIRQLGAVTSTQAGRIVHGHRDPPCRRCVSTHDRCPYAASDGGDALKRLRDRGLVRRVRAGTWVAVIK
jgi:hypothetical protein